MIISLIGNDWFTVVAIVIVQRNGQILSAPTLMFSYNGTYENLEIAQLMSGRQGRRPLRWIHTLYYSVGIGENSNERADNICPYFDV